jgi:hypothetical protein
LNDIDSGETAERQVEKFCWERWIRLVGYVKRKAEQHRAKKEQESSTDRAARRTAWATIAIAFFTLVQVGVGIVTWTVLNGQLKEMHDSSTDTHTLAQAADSQAKKMTDVSTAADKIRQAADNMVAQDQRIADNAQKAMDASNRQSHASLDATIAASTLDQRAWIGIGAFRVVQFDKDVLKIDIEVRNSGKTPALDVSEAAKYGYNFSLDPGPQEDWFTSLTFDPAEAIPPGGSHIIHLTVTSAQISPIYESVKSKAFRIYVFGEIKYADISRKVDGITDFCLLMSDPDKLELGFCRNHNNMK